MAQRRRREREMKRRQRQMTLLCVAGGLGAALLSLIICLIVFDLPTPEQETSVPASAALPYEADQPFSVSDLSAAQLAQIRDRGRIAVADGPRGVAIGDTLETVLARFPTSYLGEQSDNIEILYCAEVFTNQNGITTVLPPRGLLTQNTTDIEITLLAPTSAYPAGTKDNYGSYEHIYCVITIEPETMTVSTIELGIDK